MVVHDRIDVGDRGKHPFVAARESRHEMRLNETHDNALVCFDVLFVVTDTPSIPPSFRPISSSRDRAPLWLTTLYFFQHLRPDHLKPALQHRRVAADATRFR